MLAQILKSIGLLVSDLSGTLLFALLLVLGVDVLVATLAGIALALATVAWTVARQRPVGMIQGLSLVLVLVSGLGTILTNDPRYVMAKLSVVSAIVGAFMLRPGWLQRYVPEELGRDVRDVTWIFGFIWSGLMFLTAALNMLFVLKYPQHWPAFIAVFPALSKLLLFALQWGLSIVIANLRRSREALAGAAVVADS